MIDQRLQPADGAGHDRGTARRRLERDEAEALAAARHDDDVGGPVVRRQDVMRLGLDEVQLVVEAELINCADAICVSCREEEQQFRRLYGEPQGQIEIIAPGVEHALFGPGDRSGARRAVGVADDVPMLLFVGRIQPLKGPDVAIRALDALGRSDAQLVIVGGASGVVGDVEIERAHQLVDELGLHDQVHFVEPQPHHILSTYYRAADVVLVPSRSESFGLVALEAAACNR